ncbi:hypothetical protein C4571_02940 [Candidatus Parcubacteria bacterium]|nr:MAG: hypothetical protein C4571_02940 [Candidatus Parcubacteria bacterium]
MQSSIEEFVRKVPITFSEYLGKSEQGRPNRLPPIVSDLSQDGWRPVGIIVFARRGACEKVQRCERRIMYITGAERYHIIPGLSPRVLLAAGAQQFAVERLRRVLTEVVEDNNHTIIELFSDLRLVRGVPVCSGSAAADLVGEFLDARLACDRAKAGTTITQEHIKSCAIHRWLEVSAHCQNISHLMQPMQLVFGPDQLGEIKKLSESSIFASPPAFLGFAHA